MVNEFDENKLKKIIGEKKIIIIDFFATWCGPCQMFGPVFEKFSTEYEKKEIIFAKVDVDKYTDFSADQGVTSIPTIVAYKDGKEFLRFTGFRSLENLKKDFKTLL
ncbi:Thioredoxin [Candidatus Hepatoplasma crinochetorum Av]|uniref:Thioredoxin n=1 Tax=Candidatus Hepatoplasma crinochetorum Av TaxID=1427984 RepID=W8GS83_9MOLU|nr:thioredoxin [Candidatus Hepatoplasma crinochetorum]AHK22305.1 Thioredoxin [Candidatus Hepatoplasma crinochetorum Av]